MYQCSCGISIDKEKFPKHKQSIRHQHFKRINKAKRHPFFVIEDETKEAPFISNFNQLIILLKYFNLKL